MTLELVLTEFSVCLFLIQVEQYHFLLFSNFILCLPFSDVTTKARAGTPDAVQLEPTHSLQAFAIVLSAALFA